MGDIISVVSGKGGVGKSTVAAGLARQLKRIAPHVLLIDTDGGIGSAQLLVRNGDRCIYHLSDVLSGNATLNEAVLKSTCEPDLLPAPNRPLTEEEWGSLALVLPRLQPYYDYIVIDRPAGFDFSLERYLNECTMLVVTTPDPLSLRGGEQACYRLNTLGCSRIRLVINRFLPSYIRQKIMPNIDVICDRVGAQLVGIVPEDPVVVHDLVKGDISRNAPYQKALGRIAQRMTGQSVPLPKLKKIGK